MEHNLLNDYGEFNVERYFCQRYSAFASTLILDVTRELTMDLANELVRVLSMEISDVKRIREDWKMSKYKDDSPQKDFPQNALLEIESLGICIRIDNSVGTLQITYYYDCNRAESLTWIRKSCAEVRRRFSPALSPTFLLLAKSPHGFYTEDIVINKMELDLATHYNSDFIPVHEDIVSSFDNQKSGMILLHGKPGTGKTSYIKFLSQKFHEKSFLFVPNDFVGEILQPEFVSFLLTQKNAILVIEDAEKVIQSRESNVRQSVVSTILQLSDGIFSDYLNIKIICTFNTDLRNIDKALWRKGRMIAFYEFKDLVLEKTNTLLASMGAEPSEVPMTLAEIYYRHQNLYGSIEKKIGFDTNTTS